jgi:nucleoside phosphorylase
MSVQTEHSGTAACERPSTGRLGSVILVLAALRFEASAFADVKRTCGHRVRVVTTGLGPIRAALAARRALAEQRPDFVLGVGLCGALDPAEPVGAIAVPAEIVSDDGSDAVLSAAPLPALASRGRMVSTERVAATPAAKEKLRRVHNAFWVDQESYAWCREAAAAGVPFAALRVVLDRAEEPLPRLCDPYSWPMAFRLPRQALQARQRLASVGRWLICERL